MYSLLIGTCINQTIQYVMQPIEHYLRYSSVKIVTQLDVFLTLAQDMGTKKRDRLAPVHGLRT